MVWTVALSNFFEIRLEVSSGLRSVHAAGKHRCDPPGMPATQMLAEINETPALGALYPRGHSHIDEYQFQHARGRTELDRFKAKDAASLCIVSRFTADIGFAVFLEQSTFGKALEMAEMCLCHGMHMELACEFQGFGGLEREFNDGESLAIQVGDIRFYRQSID